MNKKITISILVLIISLFLLSPLAFSKSRIKAFANINFGDSQVVVRQKINNNPKFKITSNDKGQTEILIKLWDKNYKVEFQYHKNKLHTLTFIIKKGSSNYSKIESLNDFLAQLVSKKYGDPTFTYDAYNEIGESKSYYNGNQSWEYYWQMKSDKKIEIGSYYNYYKKHGKSIYRNYVLIMYDPYMPTKESEIKDGFDSL